MKWALKNLKMEKTGRRENGRRLGQNRDEEWHRFGHGNPECFGSVCQGRSNEEKGPG